MPPAPSARDLLAIGDALRRVITDAISGRCPVELAVTRALAVVIAPADLDGPAERPIERRNRANAEALAQLVELERQGHGRSAIRILARKLEHLQNESL